MKTTSLLSLALAAVLTVGMASGAAAQAAAPSDRAGFTVEALSSQPVEAPTPENLDGSKVNAKLQNEVKRLSDAYFAKVRSGEDAGSLRVESISRLKKLAESDSQNVSLYSLLGYLLLQNGDAAEAIPHISKVNGKSKYDSVNFNNAQNLALAYYLTRDYTKASETYESIGLDRMAFSVARFAGSAMLMANRNQEAVTYLTKAKADVTGPERASLLKDLAVAHIRLGNNAEALDVYEDLADEDGLEVEVLSWMGYTYLKEGKTDQAISTLESALAKSPNDAAVLVNLGNAYTTRAAAGDSAKALTVYNKLIQLSPNNAVAHYNVGVLRMKAGDHAAAIPSFQAAARLVSGAEARFALNNLGFCHEKLGQWKEAASAYARASDLETSNGLYAKNAGMAYARINETELSSRYLGRANAAGMGGGVVNSNLVEAMVREGKTAEALDMLNKMAVEKPNDADVWFNIGVLSHRLGKMQESEAAYRKSLEIRPDDGDCLKNLGLLLIEKGEAAEAAVLLEKMTTSHPGSIDGRLALASAYVKLDKTQEAVNVWRDVVRMDGSQVDARLNLADGLWNMGLVRDARFHYSTVLKNQANNARALNGMGLWHLSQGDAKQAESFFRRSMTSDANYLPAYNNLAISLERLNQKAQAILILRRALQRDPNFEDARTNLERLEKPANMAL